QPVPVVTPSIKNELPPDPVQPMRSPEIARHELEQPPRPGTHQQVAPVASMEPNAVASYFAKIDAIQVEGGGDPTAFAQGILSGVQGGDLSRVDALVN